MTSGEYSNYHIDAVFDSREAAEVYCALGHGEYVEDYDVNAEATTNPMQSIVYRYLVCFPSNDTGWIFDPSYILESDIEADKKRIEANKRYYAKWNVIDCDRHTDRYVYLKERNKSKALKIVRDRIAKAKAEREEL